MLVPFVALTVVVGVLGVLFVSNELGRRAERSLNEQLTRLIVEARSFLHERELAVLEAGNYAANVQGMAGAIIRRDEAAAGRLLESVLALKPDLAHAVVLTADATPVAQRGSGTSDSPAWDALPFVRDALASSAGERTAGLIGGNPPRVAVAAPVCSGDRACDPVGLAVVSMPAAMLLDAAPPSNAERRALFAELSAMPLAATGAAIPPPPASAGRGGAVRHTFGSGQNQTSVLYAPFSLRDRPAGTMAIALPTAPAFAASRDAARRLAMILLASIAGIVVVGSLLARMIVRQVRGVVTTNQRLGAGDLSARAPVRSGDEIGELAEGVNAMADRLQAAVQTLELRVEQRTEEIRRLLTQRTQFFASLSHEFRTPLAVILAQSDRLDEGASPTTRRRTKEITATIRQSAGQALGIVNDVLDLAKAETDRVELKQERLDLRSLLREIRPTLESLASTASITCEIRIPPTLPLVHADRVRVREILLNLADNALKYTPAGGRIALTAAVDESSVRIEVRDTGRGIPEDVGDKIFEPFYRVPGADPEHGRSSTGLGLALTRRLVEAHGGAIRYEPAAGGGTTFSFTLPIDGEPSSPAASGRRRRAHAAR